MQRTTSVCASSVARTALLATSRIATAPPCAGRGTRRSDAPLPCGSTPSPAPPPSSWRQETASKPSCAVSGSTHAIVAAAPPPNRRARCSSHRQTASSPPPPVLTQTLSAPSAVPQTSPSAAGGARGRHPNAVTRAAPPASPSTDTDGCTAPGLSARRLATVTEAATRSNAAACAACAASASARRRRCSSPCGTSRNAAGSKGRAW
mmetsp:Transcript_46917/g.152495  ORF Transcript_46917/g.152495 Transcript_46917/m.152495 type:complete len:206 (+) Transcript_46917:327-944(+)